MPRGTQLFPVSGITPERVAPYRRAGADGFGIGGALYKPGVAAEGVERAAKAFVAAWGEIAQYGAAGAWQGSACERDAPRVRVRSAGQSY